VLIFDFLVSLYSSLGSEDDAVCVFFPWFDSQLVRLVDTDAIRLRHEIVEVAQASSLCEFSLLYAELDEDKPAVREYEFVCSPFVFVLVEVAVVARYSCWRLCLMGRDNDHWVQL